MHAGKRMRFPGLAHARATPGTRLETIATSPRGGARRGTRRAAEGIGYRHTVRSQHRRTTGGRSAGRSLWSRAVSKETQPALRCAAVVKRFDDFVAVGGRRGDTTATPGVDLEVRPGEIFALLGPNGAGKTTLIHCITGLARATSGRIEVYGHDVVSQFRTTRRLVGLVPQEISFDPFFTPMESLLIQMGLMGDKPDRARAEALLETFHLADHRDAYTRHLSGGMKRRLLVAKALVHRPKLLFLDEPTAGVDVELRKELWSEVERLRASGTTILLTTHYIEEAEQLADRIGVIHHGELLLVEDRDTLLARHEGQRLEDIFVGLIKDAEAESTTGAAE